MQRIIDSPQRTSTYERPFTHEGNYLVVNCTPIDTWQNDRSMNNLEKKIPVKKA